MTDPQDRGDEQPWADQYRGLVTELEEARRTVDQTRPTELKDMTKEHVDALDAMARLSDELFQVAKKFLLEYDSPPPVQP